MDPGTVTIRDYLSMDVTELGDIKFPRFHHHVLSKPQPDHQTWIERSDSDLERKISLNFCFALNISWEEINWSLT